MATADVRGEAGFRLRLTGSIAAAPDGVPVACRQPGGPEQRPVCLVAADFDEVGIEIAATGKTLVTWNVAAVGRTEAQPGDGAGAVKMPDSGSASARR